MNIKPSFLAAVLIIVLVPIGLAQESDQMQANGNENASLRATLGRVKQMLVEHYKPKVPIQNYKPAINARFVPVKFDDCNIRWKLVASLGNRSSYIIDTSLNLADLDPSNILVLLEDMRQNDRWFFELRTLNEAPKVKAERIVMNGAKVTERKVYSMSRTGFGADSQEAAQRIADDVISAIKQCSESR
jgi:hypothetical protein